VIEGATDNEIVPAVRRDRWGAFCGARRMRPMRHRTDPNVLRLAAEADGGADPRSAAKALTHGSRAVRGLAGYRLAKAMKRLGLHDPDPAIDLGTETRSDRTT
jgi:hypothetical protein